jgi:hypothetical protein
MLVSKVTVRDGPQLRRTGAVYVCAAINVNCNAQKWGKYFGTNPEWMKLFLNVKTAAYPRFQANPNPEISRLSIIDDSRWCPNGAWCHDTI